MAVEKLDFTYSIDGNLLTITPVQITTETIQDEEAGTSITVTTAEPVEILDNSQYIIQIKKLQAKDDPYKTISNFKAVVTTAMDPAYCTINDVKYLSEVFKIPEEQILYYIREASKYADYILSASGSTSTDGDEEVDFEKKQFTIIKTTLDSLIRAFVSKASGFGTSGTLGVIQFSDEENYSDALATLLDYLKGQLKSWEDALKGYKLEGRAKPQSAKRSYQQTEQTLFSQLINDLSRDIPGNV